MRIKKPYFIYHPFEILPRGHGCTICGLRGLDLIHSKDSDVGRKERTNKEILELKEKYTRWK